MFVIRKHQSAIILLLVFYVLYRYSAIAEHPVYSVGRQNGLDQDMLGGDEVSDMLGFSRLRETFE